MPVEFLTDEQAAAFGRFLARCDLVKYAKAVPPPEEVRQVLDQTRTLVQQTIPAEACIATPGDATAAVPGKEA